MNTLLRRLYSHYLMPSRLPLYRDLLQAAAAHGYQSQTLAMLARPGQSLPERVIVHRHDIDSDLSTACAWFRLEQKYGVRASYYFRLSTLERGFMRDLAAYGNEVGYHYEEVASFAKRERLRDRAAVMQALPRMQAAFRSNLQRVEDLLGQKVLTVASHGDFANRKLGISNTVLLHDAGLRQQCGLLAEAYDPALMAQFDAYISDKPPPHYFAPQSPFPLLGHVRCLCLLTHPVQWRANWSANLRLDLGRVVEGLHW